MTDARAWLAKVLPALLAAAAIAPGTGLAGAEQAATISATELAGEIRESALDPGECYRVRNVRLAKEDLKFYLTDGHLIFSKPVKGRRLWAVFSADTEGGDAEVVILPPHRSERRSLASFTKSPNLDEHFRSVWFLLGDSTPEQLLALAGGPARSSPETGAGLDAKFSPVLRTLAVSVETRLIQDLLAASRDTSLFLAALAGTRLGDFDIAFDPWSPEQILVGQAEAKDGRPAFNVWTNYESRSVRKGARSRPAPPFTMEDFQIDAELDPALHMKCTTHATIRAAAAGLQALPFRISSRMSVTGARLDGAPVEVFAKDSPRASAIRRVEDTAFLVMARAPLVAGRAYRIEFTHEGDVVTSAGNGVFYVGSRGIWYPHLGAEFARYDLTFRYPKGLTLVSTGAVAEERTEGNIRITRRQVNVPIRMAGFNLGEYDHAGMTREGYRIEVFGNRRAEPSLQPHPVLPIAPPLFQPGGHTVGGILIPPQVLGPPPEPAWGLSNLAGDVGGALDYMLGQFGPLPWKTLTVSPIPGAFGQGFPGLLYLSTAAYLPPQERPAAMRDRSQQTFYSDLLAPHETAHQWWGNLVTSASYQDGWLMEALANYSALLYVEKRKGPRAVESILDEFRSNLLVKTEDGSTVESTGPITWGTRLEGRRAADAWRTITYDKGAWIIHMLRRRMGNPRFFAMLGEFCRRYRYRSVTTEDFSDLVKEFMPRTAARGTADNFFENWVYDTGIPRLKLSYSVKGKAPALRLTATVTQSEVSDGFSCDVPVEIHFAKGPPLVRWVRTSSDPAIFSVSLKEPPVRVVLPAGTDVLAVGK